MSNVKHEAEEFLEKPQKCNLHHLLSKGDKYQVILVQTRLITWDVTADSPEQAYQAVAYTSSIENASSISSFHFASEGGRVIDKDGNVTMQAEIVK